MSKRIKRFFALPVIAAVMLQLMPGVPLFKTAKVSAKIVTSQYDVYARTNIHSGVQNYINIYNPDEQYTKLQNENSWISVSDFSTTGMTLENPTKIEANVKYHYLNGATGGYSDDSLAIQVSNGSATTTKEIKPLSLSADSTLTYDVSELYDLNSLAALSDVTNSVIKASFLATGETDSIDIYIDALWLNITSQNEIADPILATVMNLAGDFSNGKAFLSWDANPDESLLGYKIYADNQTGTIDYTEPIEELDDSQTSWTDPVELLLGSAQYAVTAYNATGESEPAVVEVANPTMTYTLSPGDSVKINQKIEMIGQGDLGEVTVTDLGTNVKPALENGIQVFGHYYKFDADDNSDLTAIFPVMLKFYFTEDDLTAAGITDPNQFNGVYFYNSVNGKWQLYDQTGVVSEPTVFDGTEFDGYVWVNANHFTPIVTGADTIAPVSTIDQLPAVETSSSFSIPFESSDLGGKGLAYTELYYRVNGGLWQKYVNAQNPFGRFIASPFDFVAASDGDYDSLTIAIDNAGNVEDKASVAQASTKVDTLVPGIVSGLNVAAGDGKVFLTWDAVSNADGYVISYYSDGGQVSTVDVGNVNKATIIGLENGKNYTFRVAAYRSSNINLGQSASVQISPKASVEPVSIPALIPRASAEESAPSQQIEQIKPTDQPSIQESPDSTDQGEVKGTEEDQPKDWTNVIIILSLLVILAAAVAGYYSYQWWTTKPKKSAPKPRPKSAKDTGKNRW